MKEKYREGRKGKRKINLNKGKGRRENDWVSKWISRYKLYRVNEWIKEWMIEKIIF
jgi:hypothetical protein